MALSKSTLETQLNSWLSNSIAYTTLADSAIAFAAAYVAFASSATANGQPIIVSTINPSLISNEIISTVPSFDPTGTLWAIAVGNGITSFWSSIQFNPVPGPIIVSTPPIATSMSTPLLAAMFGTYILPGTTNSIVAASMANILYAPFLTVSVMATVIPPSPAPPYIVPVI